MRYFTIKELAKSATAEKYGLKNEPEIQERVLLKSLVKSVSDPLREQLGRPVELTCAYPG